MTLNIEGKKLRWDRNSFLSLAHTCDWVHTLVVRKSASCLEPGKELLVLELRTGWENWCPVWKCYTRIKVVNLWPSFHRGLSVMLIFFSRLLLFLFALTWRNWIPNQGSIEEDDGVRFRNLLAVTFRFDGVLVFRLLININFLDVGKLGRMRTGNFFV